MSTMDGDIFVRGQALAEDLRREGRRDDAEIVDILLGVAGTPVSTARFLTTGQVAKRLGVSRQTVVNWVKRGVIPGTRLGGRLVIPVSVMEKFDPISRILDDLDSQIPPLSPDEAASIVQQDRAL